MPFIISSGYAAVQILKTSESDPSSFWNILICMRVWMGGGGVWNSLISKTLAHYSLCLKFLLIL